MARPRVAPVTDSRVAGRDRGPGPKPCGGGARACRGGGGRARLSERPGAVPGFVVSMKCPSCAPCKAPSLRGDGASSMRSSMCHGVALRRFVTAAIDAHEEHIRTDLDRRSHAEDLVVDMRMH